MKEPPRFSVECEKLVRDFFRQHCLEADVAWLNERGDSGLPYDIEVSSPQSSLRRLIHVEATKGNGANLLAFPIALPDARRWIRLYSEGLESADTRLVEVVVVNVNARSASLLRWDVLRQQAAVQAEAAAQFGRVEIHYCDMSELFTLDDATARRLGDLYAAECELRRRAA